MAHPLLHEYQAALEAYEFVMQAREDAIARAKQSRDPRDIQAVRENFEVGNDLEQIIIKMRARGLRDFSEGPPEV